MAYILLGILVLALLASFFIAYMGSQTWPIYQTVLVAFIFIAATAFFYLSARTLATHKSWRELYNRNRDQVTQLESQLLPLTGGLDPRGGAVAGEIPALKLELAMAVTSRGGGVYYNVKTDSVQDGVLQLTLGPPGTLPPVKKQLAQGEAGVDGEMPSDVEPPVDPTAMEPAAADASGQPAGEKPAFSHALELNTVVFVFDQKSITEGGRYLGEFKVTEATPENPTVKIAPSLPLSPAQVTALETLVPGAVVLYTAMPPDDALVYSALDDATRQAMLPAAVVAEYAQADRPLRDYHAFFHENFVQRGLLNNTITLTTSNIQRIEAAAAETTKESGYRETERGNLATDLAGFQQEVTAISAYEKSLLQLLSQVRTQLKATYLENRQSADTLTRSQLEAADEINRRTEVAAQSPS